MTVRQFYYQTGWNIHWNIGGVFWRIPANAGELDAGTLKTGKALQALGNLNTRKAFLWYAWQDSNLRPAVGNREHVSVTAYLAMSYCDSAATLCRQLCHTAAKRANKDTAQTERRARGQQQESRLRPSSRWARADGRRTAADMHLGTVHRTCSH